MSLREDGLYADKTLPDGRWAYVWPLTYQRARISVAPHKDAVLVEDNW